MGLHVSNIYKLFIDSVFQMGAAIGHNTASENWRKDKNKK